MKTNNFSAKFISFFAVALSVFVLCFSVFGLLPSYNSFAYDPSVDDSYAVSVISSSVAINLPRTSAFSSSSSPVITNYTFTSTFSGSGGGIEYSYSLDPDDQIGYVFSSSTGVSPFVFSNAGSHNAPTYTPMNGGSVFVSTSSNSSVTPYTNCYGSIYYSYGVSSLVFYSGIPFTFSFTIRSSYSDYFSGKSVYFYPSVYFPVRSDGSSQSVPASYDSGYRYPGSSVGYEDIVLNFLPFAPVLLTEIDSTHYSCEFTITPAFFNYLLFLSNASLVVNSSSYQYHYFNSSYGVFCLWDNSFVYENGLSVFPDSGYMNPLIPADYPPAELPGGDYDTGYDDGYKEGYTDGLNKGQSDLFTSPLDMVFKPVEQFLSMELFGNISIGTFLSFAVFIMIALIFLKMFAGG